MSRSAAKKTTEDMFSELQIQLAALATLPASIASLTTRFAALETMVIDLSKENKCLRDELAVRDEEVFALRSQVISMDQHNRGWSVRVANLKIPAADAFNNFKVRDLVYNTVFLPILRGAFEAGDLPAIPASAELLERAHILPVRGDKPASVIARFNNRDIRALVFKHRRDHQTREPVSASSRLNTRGPPRGRYLNPFYQDLSKPIFLKMRALSSHADVQSAWTTNGSIRYRLVSEPDNVKRVQNILDPVDKILCSLYS